MSERWTDSSSTSSTATVLVRGLLLPPFSTTTRRLLALCSRRWRRSGHISRNARPPDDHLLAHSTQTGVLLSLQPFNDLVRGHLFSAPLFMPAQPFVVLLLSSSCHVSAVNTWLNTSPSAAARDRRPPAGVGPSILPPACCGLSQKGQGSRLRVGSEVTRDVPPVSWCYRHSPLLYFPVVTIGVLRCEAAG